MNKITVTPKMLICMENGSGEKTDALIKRLSEFLEQNNFVVSSENGVLSFSRFAKKQQQGQQEFKCPRICCRDVTQKKPAAGEIMN